MLANTYLPPKSMGFDAMISGKLGRSVVMVFLGLISASCARMVARSVAIGSLAWTLELDGNDVRRCV